MFGYARSKFLISASNAAVALFGNSALSVTACCGFAEAAESPTVSAPTRPGARQHERQPLATHGVRPPVLATRRRCPHRRSMLTLDCQKSIARTEVAAEADRQAQDRAKHRVSTPLDVVGGELQI